MNVEIWNDTSAFRQRTGTSFSAPMVAGIAALLKSLDPTLTPESIKGLIVQGAAAGNRPILNHPGRFLVNAYSSLKLAGQKAGTPLCGNRIWLEGRSSLQVLRGATTEILDAVTDTAWAVAPEHGGRRVLYATTSGVRARKFVPGSGVWVADTTSQIATSIEPTAKSHDGDSTASLNIIASGTQRDVQVLVAGPSGSPTIVGTVSFTGLAAGAPFCVEQIPGGGPSHCAIPSSVYLYDVAYPPSGGKLLLTINHIRSRPYGGVCGAPMPTPCDPVLNLDYESQWYSVYEIDIAGQVPAQLLATEQSKSSFWMAAAEDNTELAGATAFKLYRSLAVTGGIPWQNRNFALGCEIKYRNRSLQVVLQTIAASDACHSNYYFYTDNHRGGGGFGKVAPNVPSQRADTTFVPALSDDEIRRLMLRP